MPAAKFKTSHISVTKHQPFSQLGSTSNQENGRKGLITVQGFDLSTPKSQAPKRKRRVKARIIKLPSSTPQDENSRPLDFQTGAQGRASGSVKSIPRGLKARTTTDKCIVLDLDETLVHSFEEMSYHAKLDFKKYPELRSRVKILSMIDVLDPRGSGVEEKMWTILRPHVREFLIFCFSHFRMVMVWSAGIGGYVQEVVNVIFQGLPEPHMVWSRKHCTPTRLKVGNQTETVHVKDLRKIWTHPELGKYANPSNTLLLDDRSESCKSIAPHNALTNRAYRPGTREEQILAEEIGLLQTMEWFTNPSVQKCSDVQTVDKKIYHLSLGQIRAGQFGPQ